LTLTDGLWELFLPRFSALAVDRLSIIPGCTCNRNSSGLCLWTGGRAISAHGHLTRRCFRLHRGRCCVRDGRRPIILAIRVILKHSRKFFACLSSMRHVQLDRKAHVVLHRDPCVLHADVVGGWRRRVEGESRRSRGERQQNQESRETPRDSKPSLDDSGLHDSGLQDSYQRKPWRCSCSNCFIKLRVRERR